MSESMTLPPIPVDPDDFPFDTTLLQEILVRVNRLAYAERRWLIARIAADVQNVGEWR